MPKFICVAGDVSGIGKSTIALGLLGVLAKTYPLEKLAYIKPATQCVSAQPVVRWCSANDVACIGVGPVVFKHGYTYDVLDGRDGSEADRLSKIVSACHKIGEGKDVVVVDGVGFAAVGSVAGVSNAQVAAALGAPTILVSKPGVGGTIDMVNMMLSYYDNHKATILGMIVNYRESPGRHSLENTTNYVSKYFRRTRPKLSMLGFIPVCTNLAKLFGRKCQIGEGPLEVEKFTEEEAEAVNTFLNHFEKHFDGEEFLVKFNHYYKQSYLRNLGLLGGVAVMFILYRALKSSKSSNT